MVGVSQYIPLLFFLSFSIALVQFAQHPDTVMALVGCGVRQGLHPVEDTAGCIYTFVLAPNGERFDLLHRTETPQVYTIHTK